MNLKYIDYCNNIVLYLLYLWLFKDTTNYAIVKTTLKGNEQQTKMQMFYLVVFL